MRIQVLFAILAITLLYGCSRHAPAEKAADSDAPVVSGTHIRLPENSPQLSRLQTIAAVAEHVPQVDLAFPGKVEADPRRVSHIALPVTGRIRQVLVNVGDSVRQGQPVLTVDSPDAATAMSTYRQAQANVALSKANLAKADADLTRTRDLESHGAAPQKDVLAADAVQVQSQAALTQAQASLDESLKRMEVFGIKPGNVIDQLITIHSTVTGKVIEIAAVGGEFRNDTSTPFLTIADLSVVWVSADAPEDRLRFVRIGSTVAVKLTAYPDETFTARVARIGDVVDPQTRTIKVRAELESTRAISSDMFAEIRLSQGSVELPVIPRAALLESQGKTSVFVERSRGDFEEVPVSVAWQGPDRLAISQGIHPGDRVVNGGGMLLRGY